MDREIGVVFLAPSPSPSSNSPNSSLAAVALASGSSFAMILSALLIAATIMGVMAFCVWLCGCGPEDVIRGRSGSNLGGGSDGRSKGGASSGLSKQAIEKLPVMGYGDACLVASRRSANEELGCCSICLADFGKHDESIRVMPSCGHCFHSECIAVWLVSHSSCPICRRSLIAQDAHCCKSCGRIKAKNRPPPPPQPNSSAAAATELSFSEAVACYSVSEPPATTSSGIRLEEVVIEVPAVGD